jgi:hypothetical protein
MWYCLLSSQSPQRSQSDEPNTGCWTNPLHFYYIHLSIQRLARPLHRIQHDITLAYDHLVLRRPHSRARCLDDPVHLVNGAVQSVSGDQAAELAV